MSDSLASDNNQLDDSPAVDITGKIMVVIIILLFMVVVTFLFFHLFAKGFWWTPSRRSSDNNSQSRRRRRSGQEGGGLDPSVLNSLPISIFNSKEDGFDLECSVCLSEVVEGEKVRVLPKCNHMFHIDCIDMWFHSHSTCPLCRTTLAATPPPSSVVVVEVESSTSAAAAAFPTNVLIWGNHNQITSSSSTTSEQNTSSSSSDGDNTINNNSRADDEGNGMLRIDIPNECEATTSSSSPLSSAEGRLKSLKRLLSSSSRGIMSLNPWSPTSTVQQQTKPKEAAGQS